VGPVRAAGDVPGAAAVPADAALGVFVWDLLLALVLAHDAAAQLVELGLTFEDGALGFGRELGLQLGVGCGQFGINGGLLEGEEGLGGDTFHRRVAWIWTRRGAASAKTRPAPKPRAARAASRVCPLVVTLSTK